MMKRTNRASNEVEQRAKHILLVEDDYISLTILEHILTYYNFTYLSSRSSTSALALVQHISFDMIITDIGLPDFSGIELAQTIRQLEQQQNRQPIPIIGLSAHVDDTDRLNAINAGMNLLLLKPMTHDLWQQLSSHYFFY